MTHSSDDKSCHTPHPSDELTIRQVVVKATVLRTDAGGVWVTSPVSTSCSGCQQQDSCSSGLVAKALPVRQQQLFVANVSGLLAGQQVEISVEPGAVLRSALLVYLLPLCVFIAALGLGYAQAWHELLQLAAALLATAFTLWLVRRVELNRADQLRVTLVRVLPDVIVLQPLAQRAPA
jgi:sigma-E factor negative regulatory protein RseC